MRIANPLYDQAFKFLMSNDRLAKKVLSVILDKEVLELEFSPQEYVVLDTERQFTLYRLDFKAKIQDAEGNTETVLIELQKSKLPSNIQRFRNYLGAAFSEKRHIEKNGITEAVSYPIISIYILGYNLTDIPVMAAMVDRRIIDMSSHKEMNIQSDFIDLVTNRCYVLQVRRLPLKRMTRIEQFMSLFNQAWVKEKNFILDLEEVPEEFEEIAEYLKKPLLDEEQRKKLEAEQEIEDVFGSLEAEQKRLENELGEERRLRIEEAQKAETERKLKEEATHKAETERKLKEAAAKKAEAATQKAETERKLKEEATQKAEEATQKAKTERKLKEEAQQKLLAMAKQLLAMGTPIQQVANMTGLSVSDLEDLG